MGHMVYNCEYTWQDPQIRKCIKTNDDGASHSVFNWTKLKRKEPPCQVATHWIIPIPSQSIFLLFLETWTRLRLIGNILYYRSLFTNPTTPHSKISLIKYYKNPQIQYYKTPLFFSLKALDSLLF